MTEPDFGQTPEWLAFELDPATDRVALLRMTKEAYREASFLDQRISARPRDPAPTGRARRRRPGRRGATSSISSIS